LPKAYFCCFNNKTKIRGGSKSKKFRPPLLFGKLASQRLELGGVMIVLLFNKLFISSNILVSFIKNNFNKDIGLKFDYYRLKIEKFNNSFFI
jgi:hypothetical protein